MRPLAGLTPLPLAGLAPLPEDSRRWRPWLPSLDMRRGVCGLGAPPRIEPAPWSLLASSTATSSTPLLWSEGALRSPNRRGGGITHLHRSVVEAVMHPCMPSPSRLALPTESPSTALHESSDQAEVCLAEMPKEAANHLPCRTADFASAGSCNAPPAVLPDCKLLGFAPLDLSCIIEAAKACSAAMTVQRAPLAC